MALIDDLQAKLIEVKNANDVLFPALEGKENELVFLNVPNDLTVIDNEILKLATAPDLITIQDIIRDSAQAVFDAQLILINASPESAIDQLILEQFTDPEKALLKPEYVKVLVIDIADRKQEITDATGIIIA